jgi:Helix-turn-helix domain
MSIRAIRYTKTLTTAPKGELITPTEKALLWYLGDSYNDEEGAAWPSIATIAKQNNLGRRHVRQVLSGLIRKGVLWREPHLRSDGSNGSNRWHFTIFDGEPPAHVAIYEERLQLRGRQAAHAANRSKGIKIPTEACESRCQIQHPASAQVNVPGCLPLQSEPDDSGRGGCIPGRGGCERPDILACEIFHPLNPYSTHIESPAISYVTETETLTETEGSSNCGKHNNLWSDMLEQLAKDAIIDTRMYDHLRAKTKQVSGEEYEGFLHIVVRLPDPNYATFLAKLQESVESAFGVIGIDPAVVRLQYLLPQRGGGQ